MTNNIENEVERLAKQFEWLKEFASTPNPECSTSVYDDIVQTISSLTEQHHREKEVIVDEIGKRIKSYANYTIEERNIEGSYKSDYVDMSDVELVLQNYKKTKT